MMINMLERKEKIDSVCIIIIRRCSCLSVKEEGEEVCNSISNIVFVALWLVVGWGIVKCASPEVVECKKREAAVKCLWLLVY